MNPFGNHLLTLTLTPLPFCGRFIGFSCWKLRHQQHLESGVLRMPHNSFLKFLPRLNRWVGFRHRRFISRSLFWLVVESWQPSLNIRNAGELSESSSLSHHSTIKILSFCTYSCLLLGICKLSLSWGKFSPGAGD